MSRATSKIGDYSVHNEWQIHKSGYKFKKVRKDRKTVAEIREESGKKIAIVPKRAEDFVFNKDRIAIPRSLSMVILCLGRPDIMVEVSNGDTYLITYAEFEKHQYFQIDGKATPYWFVDSEHWVFTKGEPESVEKSLKVGKWK